MYRGTTPTLKIKVKGADLSIFKNIYVTIRQGNTEVTKESEKGQLRINIETNVISMPLTQEDTLKFSRGHVDIQMRGITENNRAVASNIKMWSMNRILKEGVIS